jgi:hypothetical protein
VLKVHLVPGEIHTLPCKVLVVTQYKHANTMRQTLHCLAQHAPLATWEWYARRGVCLLDYRHACGQAGEGEGEGGGG